MDVSIQHIQELYQRIRGEIEKVIVGQDQIVRLLLACLFSRGHCLLIGVPGLAKTLLVKSLSETLDLSFNRIQFTPDLMPADIIGSEIVHEEEGQLNFKYQAGPIFTNLLLADEINRTPPKTQSALLEAMQERKVTVAGETRPLPEPFLVVATQNPIEQEGTYPLPEAQLDRFMFSLVLDYPDKQEEVEIVRRTTIHGLPDLKAQVTKEELIAAQELVLHAPVTDHIIDYAVELTRATRPNAPDPINAIRNYVQWGAGPRASQNLILGAKALALMEGRATPEAQDLAEAFIPVLQHRIITNYRATGDNVDAVQILQEISQNVQQAAY